MRLSLLILLAVAAVVVVSGQDLTRRQKARARFRALADAARNGDQSAQQILQSRRRSRPHQHDESRTSQFNDAEPDPVTEPPTTLAPARVRIPSRRTRVRIPRPVSVGSRSSQFNDAEPDPVTEPPTTLAPTRVRIPSLRTRVRIPQPVSVEPTTFHPPAVFPPTPAPAPVTLVPEVIQVTDPVTEEPVFPTEPPTAAPVFQIQNTPASVRIRQRIQPLRPIPAPQQQRVRSRPAFEQPQALNFDVQPEKKKPVFQNTPAPVRTRQRTPLRPIPAPQQQLVRSRPAFEQPQVLNFDVQPEKVEPVFQNTPAPVRSRQRIQPLRPIPAPQQQRVRSRPAFEQPQVLNFDVQPEKVEPVFQNTPAPVRTRQRTPLRPIPAPQQQLVRSRPAFEQPQVLNFDVQPEIEKPVFQNTPAPARSRQLLRSQRPQPTFERSQASNFDLEPHRALNTGLEVDNRSEHIIPRRGTTEAPVETIRRFAYFDEGGNYIFGYEAADGSFKEEKRGLDCIVTGKYGYVDPEGTRREFSYTSGNRCDPNAVVDPELQEVPDLPPNDQFLHQTVEQRLSEAELNELQFNRHRRPLKQSQPQEQSLVQRPHRQRGQQQVQQTIQSHNLRRQPASSILRTATQTVQRQEPQQNQGFEPVAATPAPHSRFTTPASFNQFKRPSFSRPQTVRVQEEPSVQQVSRPAPTPTPTPQPKPVVETKPPPKVVKTPAPHLFAERPKPKPASFDFDREFRNLFTHFGASQQNTNRPFFTAPTTPPTRPPPPPPPPSSTSAPTTRSSPPPTSRSTQPPSFPPVTAAPVTSRPPPLDDGSSTLGGGGGAHQLVFDRATGTFKTVFVKSPPRPSVSTPVHNPFLPATSAPSAGVPLPPPNRPVGFNPLPPVPTGGLVINQPGRSPATDEFDKFFSQFNLRF